MNIKVNMSEKQGACLEALYDDIHTEIFFGGSAGSGKSLLGTFRLRSMCMKYPGYQGGMGRKVLKSLKLTTLATYYKMLELFNIPETYKGTYRDQQGIIDYPNGSKIILFDLAYNPSDPDYTRFGSFELDGFLADEGAEVDARAINIIKTRLGRGVCAKYNLKPKLFIASNPADGWCKQDFYTASKEGTMAPRRAAFFSTVYDNVFVSDEYIKQLERSEESVKQRLLRGNREWEENDLALFQHYEIDALFYQRENTSTDMYITCDVARLGKDRTVIMVWRGLEVISHKMFEVSRVNTIVDEIKKLQSLYSVPTENVIIDADGVGGGVVDYVPGCIGFVNNSTAYKGISTNNYGNLKTQCAFQVKAEMQKGTLNLSYFNTEERLILGEEFRSIRIKDNQTATDSKIQLESKDKLKERLGRSPDYFDAVLMRMYPEVRYHKSDTEGGSSAIVPSISFTPTFMM